MFLGSIRIGMGCMNYSEDASNSASNGEDAPIGEVRLITRDYGICERCVWTILPITLISAAVAIRVDWCVIFTTLYAALPCILPRTFHHGVHFCVEYA